MIGARRLPDHRARRRRSRRRPRPRRPWRTPPRPSSVLLLLRAFAAGAVALTGTEAIATGVPAFKPPEAKNAAPTLWRWRCILAILFIGITFLAVNFGIVPIDEPEKQTVIAQVAATVFGDDSFGFYLFQAFTALLLFLAANTSLRRLPAPRRDPRRGRLHPPPVRVPRRPPRVLDGHRRVGARGGAAGRSPSAARRTPLIPLYAVGVFIDFTISPGRHGPPLAARASRPAGGGAWRSTRSAASLTGIVAVVVTAVKFVGRRLARPAAHPDPRRGDAVHPPPVRRPGARARGPRRRSSSTGRTASSASSSRSTASTAPSSRR